MKYNKYRTNHKKALCACDNAYSKELAMYEKLTALLPDLASGEYGQWVVDHENDGTKEHPVHMPFVNYGKVMLDFERATYDFVDQHREMELTRYEKILKMSGIEWSFKSMTDADVTEIEGQTVMALLVAAIRADHFSEGTLLGFFENGSIKKWLSRLQEIDNTNT